MMNYPSSFAHSTRPPVDRRSSTYIPSPLSGGRKNPEYIKNSADRRRHDVGHFRYGEQAAGGSTNGNLTVSFAGGSREPLRHTTIHQMDSPTTPSRHASKEEQFILASPCEQYVSRRRSSLQKGQLKPRSILRRRLSDENDPMLGIAYAACNPVASKRMRKRVSFARVEEDKGRAAHSRVSGHRLKPARLCDLMAEEKHDRYNCYAVNEPTYNVEAVIIEPPSPSRTRLHRVGESQRGHPVKSYVEDIDAIVGLLPTLSLQGSDDMDVDQRSFHTSHGVFGASRDTGARGGNTSRCRRYTPY
ncbi:hypothetical protein C8Q80DRAFT_1167081 [Daedaleopsis nitida]|nr:hypothetical protein C8Q80DRAFT_1167081 [Daedaleopsis nitida]